METSTLRPTQQLVVDAFKKHCVTEGDFTLASGRKSKWYCIGRDLTFRGDSIELVGHAIMDALEAGEKETGKNLTDFDAVGGIVVGTIPVAMAVANVTGIAGPLKPGQKVLIVEDTVTTGGSLLPSIEAVQNFGCEVIGVAALLDRGGVISGICEEKDLTFVSSISAPDLGFELGS